MIVYYYDHPSEGFVFVASRGLAPGKLSLVWSQCNANVWIVPGTTVEEDE